MAKKDEAKPEKAAKGPPDPSLDTPSGAALAKVGVPAEDLEPAELLKHGERYNAEKAKKRWGYG